MNSDLKCARDWLAQSSKSAFYNMIEEAKITPRQRRITEMRFVNGLMNYQISMEMDLSVKTVENDIKTAYKAVARMLQLQELQHSSYH